MRRQPAVRENRVPVPLFAAPDSRATARLHARLQRFQAALADAMRAHAATTRELEEAHQFTARQAETIQELRARVDELERERAALLTPRVEAP